MKIIISQTFNKRFLVKMKRYFSTEDFVNVLKDYKFGILLKDPYFKIKVKIRQVSFRGVVILVQDEKIIPVSIYLKKDKKNGENIIWNDHKAQILFLQEKIALDLTNKDFKIYE